MAAQADRRVVSVHTHLDTVVWASNFLVNVNTVAIEDYVVDMVTSAEVQAFRCLARRD